MTMNVAAFGIGVFGLLIGAVLCLVALFKALGAEKIEDIADLRGHGHRPHQHPDQNSAIPGRDHRTCIVQRGLNPIWHGS
jgi:hypothetical protein